MKLTRTQKRSIERITSNCQRHAELLSDVSMVWQVLPMANKTVELRGMNHECERRWFDSGRVYQAFIGELGGVKISSATDKLYNRIK